MLEEVPDREVTHLDPARGKLGAERPQRDVRFLGHTSQQPFSFASQRKWPPATHLVGCRAPSRPEPLRPLHHTGNTDLKRRRHRPAALTSRHSRNDALSQIK